MVWGERVLIVRQDKPKTCGFEGEKITRKVMGTD